MKLFANLAVLLSVECLTLERNAASSMLNRSRRANERLGASELREGNFERECVEEVCSTEEFHEVYDDFFASTKKLSKFQKCVKANPHSDTRTRASKNYLRECFYREDINKTGFQTDSTKPRCDWLMLSESFSHWLRAPSSQNQSENPPKSFCQGKPNGNYADPNNPKGFIQCHQNGQTTFTQCGTGLVYDKNNGICNWS